MCRGRRLCLHLSRDFLFYFFPFNPVHSGLTRHCFMIFVKFYYFSCCIIIIFFCPRLRLRVHCSLLFFCANCYFAVAHFLLFLEKKKFHVETFLGFFFLHFSPRGRKLAHATAAILPKDYESTTNSSVIKFSNMRGGRTYTMLPNHRVCRCTGALRQGAGRRFLLSFQLDFVCR